MASHSERSTSTHSTETGVPGVTETVEYPAEVDMGEEVVMVIEDHTIQAYLSDRAFILDPRTIHGRMALRAYAYSVAADGHTDEARAMLRQVGRQG